LRRQELLIGSQIMRFHPERVRQNVRKSTTEDLLDRVTVYRHGMEPEAVEIIESELADRDVLPAEIEAHAARRSKEVIFAPDRTGLKCSFCDRPAVVQGWGWHRMWGWVPLFRRFYAYCEVHRAKDPESE